MSAYPPVPFARIELIDCLQCGGFSAELVSCCADGCDSRLHKRCADTCEICGKAICSACVDYWDECTYCPVCVLEMQHADDAVVLEELTLS